MQDAACGTMRLTLQFANGAIRGQGSDCDGSFIILGSFWEDVNRVELLKTYLTTQTRPYEVCVEPIPYSGYWTGEMIEGTILTPYTPFPMGEFELWPEREEDIEERRVRFDLEPAPQG